MQEEDPDLTPEEELRIENELKALNLELNHGGFTHFSDDVPPEIINQWLSNVTAFEDQYKNTPLTTVFEIIGSPQYALLDVLEDSTLPGEVERIEKMLLAHKILVSKPERIDLQEYYRFLIEDVFEHEMSAISVEDMLTVLDYDEFHPELQEVIRVFADHILLDLMNLDKSFEGGYFGENLRDDTSSVTLEQVMKTITDFRASYHKITPLTFKPEQMISEPLFIYFMFGIRWEGIPTSGKDKELHEGLGIMQFGLEEDGDWKLQGIQMPGFKF